MASDWQGISLGNTATMFTVSPTWTRLDTDPNFISSVTIDRGRQDEFERTDTGQATIVTTDRGQLDQTYADEVNSKPIGIALRNPVTGTWWPLFRGVVDEYVYDLHESQVMGKAEMRCVDMLDYLANFLLFPAADGGPPGDPPPVGSGAEQYVFYEDTIEDGFQTRITQALTDAHIPAELMSIFTGNVNLQECSYSPGESIMSVIIDAADAEFPTVANYYVDTRGIFQAHGRYARFNPEDVSESATNWDFHRWRAGDGLAIRLDPTCAQIRPPFGFSRSRAAIRNHALAYPQTYPPIVPPPKMSDQLFEDTSSQTAYGTRSWSAENLKLTEGTSTDPHTTAAEECQLYADYIIENYAQPRNRIPQITFRSLPPSDPRAAATWELICRVDISDVINVSISHPGGGGFAEDFYVEGLHYTLLPRGRSLDTDYPDVTLTIDLSPAAYWTTNPFPPLP